MSAPKAAEETVVSAVAAVLVAHQRQSAQGCLCGCGGRFCLCGWDDLGRSHPEHVAQQLQAAGLLREVAR